MGLSLESIDGTEGSETESVGMAPSGVAEGSTGIEVLAAAVLRLDALLVDEFLRLVAIAPCPLLYRITACQLPEELAQVALQTKVVINYES